MEPFLGEIKMWSFDYAPKGYSFCNGASVPVIQNAALYSLIGNTFGGDTTNFKLPNLQGRIPIGREPGLDVGSKGGAATVSLGVPQLPAHTHAVIASKDSAGNTNPSGNYLAEPGMFAMYTNLPPTSTQLSPKAVSDSGNANVTHLNMQPYLAINFCIAMTGAYPDRP